MKKSMKKFMIACAAVSSIAIAAGMSAMAADISSQYVTEGENANSIPIATPDGAADGEQMTVLVVPTDKKAAVKDEDILYINQAVKGELPATALLKGESLPNGTYSVLVGYYDAQKEFKIAEDTFTIGEPAGGTHDVLVGDADQNKRITTNDASAVLQHTSRVKTLEGDAFTAAAKSDGNERITTADASEILKYTSRIPTDHVGTTVQVAD